MRLSGVLVAWLACVVVVWGYDYQDEPNSSQEESIEQQKTSNVQEDPKEDITLDNFKRKKRHWVYLGDEAFDATNDPEGKFKKTKAELKKAKKKRPRGGGFRSSGKSRGSKVDLSKKVKPFPHEPSEKDPKGCGNPICVVIDRKPRRFKSICEYSKFACENSRKNQMNFIQKGDCYDLIDNNEGKTTTKPWTPTDLDLGDCSECKEDDYCKKPITINIDLKNLLFGESSAFGGTYNDADGERMVGVPITFDNVCSLFKYMKSKEHLNIKTQVIGVAIGKIEDIVPLDENSDKCLWTEWFDHDTPCATKGDSEVFSKHYGRLATSYTGDLRICPDCQIVLTQHEGGSEITQIGACDAENGRATGFEGEAFTNIFKTRGPLEIQCLNKDQNITKLPAPFYFTEGIENEKKDINPGCLDYKARYCCKGNRMYRPTPLEYFSRFIKPRLPLGPAIPDIKVGHDSVLKSATITIFPPTPYGTYNCFIHITFVNKEKTCFLEIKNHKRETTVKGSYITKKSGDKMEIMIKFRDTTGFLDGAIIITTGSGGEKLKTVIKTKDGVKIDSEYKEGGDGSCEGYNNYGEGRCREIVTTITDSNGGQQVIISDEGTGVIKETKGDDVILYPEPSDDAEFWEKISYIIADLRVGYFIESPPLARIFAECNWKGWVSERYPDKSGQGDEWEMRGMGDQDRMCGDVLEEAHYVGAVTIEDQIPWHELKAENGQQYEVYKLTPFHGYICNDKNMPGNKKYCKDMKVRYCCAKALRAQWGPWGEWSDCTVTCGGGKRTRTKKCKQNDKRKGTLELKTYYNKKCVGEEDPVRKKQMSEQTMQCNVERCPVDFTWTHWSVWSSCSVSCNQGTKTRERTCSPSQNGGTECPDKLEQNELYREEVPCTNADCEIFFESEWTEYSICSVTCGKGKRSRTRKCQSDTTLQMVSSDKCSNEKSHFHQIDDCMMPGCPVDGKWGKWTQWSSCNQNCVNYPGNGHSMARRSRQRSCDSPKQAFTGKHCKHDKKKWVAHLSAEVEKTECITHLNKKGTEREDDITPWCAERCILTEWCEWSACSQTCLELNVKDRYKEQFGEHAGYNPHAQKEYKRHASAIYLSWPEEPKILPYRKRFRSIFKEARFDGYCELGNDTKREWQTDNCVPCKEHCATPDKVNADVLDWVELSYPNPKNPKCVGYCPVDCEWGGEVQISNCQDYRNKNREENRNLLKGYYKEHYKDEKIEKNCFFSKVAKKLADKGWKDVGEAYMKELTGTIKKIHKLGDPKKINKFRNPKQVKAFDKKRQEASEDYDLENQLDELEWEYRMEMKRITDMMESKYEKLAKFPIDGLFGGKPCQLKKPPKKFLTTRKTKDKKFDKKTMHNAMPIEKRTTYDGCPELFLCPILFEDKDPFEPNPVEIICGVYSWEEWGAWGDCDKLCGKSGRVKRKRKCLNVCTEEEGEGKCPATEPTATKPALTDTDEDMCSPCPDPVLPTWTLWSEWTFVKEGEDCGTGDKLRERERICDDEQNTNEKCEGQKDDKIQRQTQVYKLKPCPSDDDEGDEGGNPDTDDNVHNEMDGDTEDDEATEDEVVELEDEVGEEDEVLTENSGPDESEEEAIDGMDPDTDDVGEGGDDEDNGNGKDGEDEGDDNDGGDDGAGDDGGDYNFHDEDEEEFDNGGDGDDYPDHEDSFDFGQFKPEAGSDYFEEYDTTE